MPKLQSKQLNGLNQPGERTRRVFRDSGRNTPWTSGKYPVKKTLADEAGLTLIELVMVIIFVSIALTALLNSFNVSITKSTDSESLTIAVQLAEEKLEEIRSDKDGRGYVYIVSDNYPQEVAPDGYANFTRTVSITDHTDYKTVSVTITHPDIPDVTLATILANY
ncbi:MAG: type II secretion system protein [Calditrichaeota bacterium]|nr:type II secretion system protein [Calditrichota bacterium]